MAESSDAVRVVTEIRGAPGRLFGRPPREVVIAGAAGTGKTRAILEWIHRRCATETLRVLLLRKTLESLKTSALVTYQEQVLQDFDGKQSVVDGVTYFGGNKIIAAAFTYGETGSRIGRAATELVRTLERLNEVGEGRPPMPVARAEASADGVSSAGGQTPGSGKATIALDVVDGATDTVAELGSRLSELDGASATLRVEADTGVASAGLADVERRRGRLDGGVAIVRAGAETGGALAALDAVRQVREALDGSRASVSIEAETLGAQTGLARIREEAAALAAAEVAVTVRAETAGAQAALATTRAQHGAMDGMVATMQVGANTAAATGAMAGARAAHAALNGATATLRVAADTSDARAGIGWAAGYAGRVLATSYIDIVTRRSTVGIGPTARHGGVPAHAHGGVVLAEMHEAGSEVLQFPDGATGVTSGRGVYAVPQGTYVSPAPASAGRGVPAVNLGGVHIHGNVYGIEELAEQVFEAGIPPLVEELRRHRTANGGGW